MTCFVKVLVKSYLKQTVCVNMLFTLAGPQRVQQVLPPHLLLQRAADRELAWLHKDFDHTDQCTLLFWYTGRAWNFTDSNSATYREGDNDPCTCQYLNFNSCFGKMSTNNKVFRPDRSFHILFQNLVEKNICTYVLQKIELICFSLVYKQLYNDKAKIVSNGFINLQNYNANKIPMCCLLLMALLIFMHSASTSSFWVTYACI